MAQRQSVVAPIARLARPCEVEHFADACFQPACLLADHHHRIALVLVLAGRGHATVVICITTVLITPSITNYNNLVRLLLPHTNVPQERSRAVAVDAFSKYFEILVSLGNLP